MDDDDEPRPESWIDDTQPSAPLTRTEAARHLGVSNSTVRRMEGTVLHPTLDAHGRHVFDRSEVLELALARAATEANDRAEGRIAAKVFTMFESASELPEIVIALKIDPRRVRELYEEWRVGLESRHQQGRRELRARVQARDEVGAKREVAAWERRLRNRSDE